MAREELNTLSPSEHHIATHTVPGHTAAEQAGMAERTEQRPDERDCQGSFTRADKEGATPMIHRLPHYTDLDSEPRSPRQIVQRVRAARSVVDPRKTANRARAYSLTPKALAYLDGPTCRVCGERHAPQHCPEIRAALMAEAGHDH